METTQLKLLFQTFDDIRHVANDGEYWTARELYPMLGYESFEDFQQAIADAKLACTNAGGEVERHFRHTEDGNYILTRYAAYLIAVNGDAGKQEVAVAQTYFVTRTRQLELIQKRMEELERLSAREKLKLTEKEFSDLMYARGVDGQGMGLIRMRGDQTLFGLSREQNVKEHLNIPKRKPVADVLPTVTLKAKDLATAMTTENARKKNLQGLVPLGREHVGNNQAVREALQKSGIKPEELPVSEDVKTIEARHRQQLRELRQAQQNEMDAIFQSSVPVKESVTKEVSDSSKTGKGKALKRKHG